MIYNFRIKIIVKVLSIVLLIVTLMVVIFKTQWIIVPVLILLSIFLLVGELIFYIEKTNKEVANFLLSIKSGDFSKYNSNDKRGSSFSLLKEAQNMIVDEFQSLRIEKEAHYFFLKTVVEHLNTAIISFDANGNVFLINEMAKILLHIPELKNISWLQHSDPVLANYLIHLPQGNNPVLELNRQGEKLKLSMRATTFSIQGIQHKLISVQNIKSEVESAELMAWEQLIHVLTHEIMNSMTPISSLSSLLKTKADLLKNKNADAGLLVDLAGGLEVIERRSLGLMDFVNNYKKINTLPVAEFKNINLNDLFIRVKMLKQEEILKHKIHLDIVIKNDALQLEADDVLLEQVLINLVNNSFEALKESAQPAIKLHAERVSNKIQIFLSDNGAGIAEENLSKIFIPFFTTTKTGSGIGLNFSKQVMRLHKGTISVTSKLKIGTEFILEFPVND